MSRTRCHFVRSWSLVVRVYFREIVAHDDCFACVLLDWFVDPKDQIISCWTDRGRKGYPIYWLASILFRIWWLRLGENDLFIGSREGKWIAWRHKESNNQQKCIGEQYLLMLASREHSAWKHNECRRIVEFYSSPDSTVEWVMLRDHTRTIALHTPSIFKLDHRLTTVVIRLPWRFNSIRFCKVRRFSHFSIRL